MNWLDDNDIDKFDYHEYDDIFNDKCCDQTMQIVKENGLKRFICNICGRYIDTTETFNSDKQQTENLEFKKNIYGSKSGDMYLTKVKNDITNEIKLIRERYNLTDMEVLNILEDFMKIRQEFIPRAAPRKGIIGAIIHNKTNGRVKLDDIAKIFNIDRSFLTRGTTRYLKAIKPFENKKSFSYINEVLFNYPPEFSQYEQIYLELIALSNAFYICYGSSVETKCAGISWLLCMTGKINMNLTQLIEKLKAVKTTIHKFYDELMIYLHARCLKNGETTENFKNRRVQLIRYFESRKLQIPHFEVKGKYLKYQDIYEF